MLCGSFSKSKEKKLRLDDVDRRIFIKTLDIWCGRVDGQEGQWGGAGRPLTVGLVGLAAPAKAWHGLPEPSEAQRRLQRP